MSRQIIGIDIDGVLNDHRTQFSKTLRVTRGKYIDPELIVKIPVHTIEGCDVSLEDEDSVFNWPNYWSGMPVSSCARETLEFLRDAGFKIWLFTRRGWPDSSKFASLQTFAGINYWSAWKSVSWLARPGIWKAIARGEDMWAGGHCLTGWPITKLTQTWLKHNGLRYDKLFIEHGNSTREDPRSRLRNRFQMAVQANIQYFVEDDPRNALKLASTCRTVFLIDQPYNRGLREKLPENVCRVLSLREVSTHFSASLRP